jgi:hypothetical protein
MDLRSHSVLREYNAHKQSQHRETNRFWLGEENVPGRAYAGGGDAHVLSLQRFALSSVGDSILTFHGIGGAFRTSWHSSLHGSGGFIAASM